MKEQVKKPSHYDIFDGVEAIDIIASSMTVEEFKGFCMGNVLKYKLRAGKKGIPRKKFKKRKKYKKYKKYIAKSTQQDMAKADYYRVLFDQCKGLCR